MKRVFFLVLNRLVLDRLVSIMPVLMMLALLMNVSSANAVNFRNGSLTYLNGDDYPVEPEKQQTLTFEYVAVGDSWDMFMFVDFKKYNNAGDGVDSNSYYGEFSPRFKLAEFAKDNLISQLSFATTFERGKDGVSSNLFGLGVDFNTSVFAYLSMNLYQRDDPDISGKGYQLTTVWAYDLQIGKVPLLIDGYFDWTFSSDESHANLHFNPQIKIDMQKWLGGTQQWYLGFEYDYWDHKFGIEDSALFDTEQNTFSLLAKWHF